MIEAFYTAGKESFTFNRPEEISKLGAMDIPSTESMLTNLYINATE